MMDRAGIGIGAEITDDGDVVRRDNEIHLVVGSGGKMDGVPFTGILKRGA